MAATQIGPVRAPEDAVRVSCASSEPMIAGITREQAKRIPLSIMRASRPQETSLPAKTIKPPAKPDGQKIARAAGTSSPLRPIRPAKSRGLTRNSEREKDDG